MVKHPVLLYREAARGYPGSLPNTHREKNLMKQERKTTTPNEDAEKTALNLALALFILYIEHRRTPRQLRALVKAWQIVARKARSPWHLAQLIRFLDEEMDEDEIPISRRGTHLLRRVQSKPLPKVPKSYDPFTWGL
jgi:hypothetical protein